MALNNYKQHKVMKDSIQGQQMVNRYMEIRLGHEQNKNLLRIQEVEATSKMKQQKKQLYIYIYIMDNYSSFISDNSIVVLCL